MKLTKIEAAEQNLRAAIILFFERGHPVPVETLNSAASGILRPMAQKRGIDVFLHDSIMVKDEFRKEWIKVLHEGQNFFKHADQDEDSEFDYKELMTHFLLAETCHLYRHLASDVHLKHRQLKEALAFEIWMGLKYPHLLKEPDGLTKLPGGELIMRYDPDDFSLWRAALGIQRG